MLLHLQLQYSIILQHLKMRVQQLAAEHSKGYMQVCCLKVAMQVLSALLPDRLACAAGFQDFSSAAFCAAIPVHLPEELSRCDVVVMHCNLAPPVVCMYVFCMWRCQRQLITLADLGYVSGGVAVVLSSVAAIDAVVAGLGLSSTYSLSFVWHCVCLPGCRLCVHSRSA
jgi:hypothetical protein